MRCLVIDRVVSSKDGIVYHTHMTCTAGEYIMLCEVLFGCRLRPHHCVEELLTFFVKKTGVGINARGVSDHGFGDDVPDSIVNEGEKRTKTYIAIFVEKHSLCTRLL